MNTIDVVVGTLGKPHGLRGEVSLILRTDQPEERLAVGTVLMLESGDGPRPLTGRSTRIQQGRWYASFEEITDRTAAEAVRGASLLTAVDPDEEAEQDPDAWYPGELKGLAVRHVDGAELGTVIDLEHYPAHDVLIVRGTDGRRVMLPFVEELVPEVDLEQGQVLADPPGGLFEDVPEDEQD